MTSRKSSSGPSGEGTPESKDDLLTTKQAAKIVGVGTTSIKRWSDEGKLPAYKTAGGHRRYRRADVERFLGVRTEDRDVDRLGWMSPQELDELPYGVIQLSDDGYVLSYNRTESKFSGISAAEAVGQHFFGQLAPCTNNRLIYGRFQQGIFDGALDFELSYTFTYRMRPTQVHLRLFREPVTKTNWVLVEPA